MTIVSDVTKRIMSDVTRGGGVVNIVLELSDFSEKGVEKITRVYADKMREQGVMTSEDTMSIDGLEWACEFTDRGEVETTNDFTGEVSKRKLWGK